jgi:DNA-binding winged helix-turn-helix (wHTH) protein/TolB-like protein/Tfp pilus assembly protein PilF
MYGADRILLRDGEVVPLTPKQFDLLLVLVEKRGRVVEKERLMEEVWPGTAVEEGNLTVNISTLRKALEEGANGARYIQTLPRRGYRFVGQVTEVADDGTGLMMQEHTQSRVIIEQEETDGVGRKALTETLPVNRNAMWKLSVAICGMLIVTAAIVLSWMWKSPKPPVSDGSRKAIAVLPFKPLIGGSRDEALELGMADTLINKLSGIRQLIVRPISDVRKYSGLEQDPLAAGRELGVDYVLEANIQIVGENTKVTWRLLSVKDGSAVWADKCDEQCSNVLELQDAISEQIAGALALKLNEEEKKQLVKRYTDSTEAFQLYSLGVSERDIKKKVEYFERAVKTDPNYALAYSGLCNVYYSFLSRGIWSPKEARQKYEWAALMAVELDDTLSEAHAQLAYVKQYNWDWASAEKEFKRALELNPNSYLAHQAYTWFLVDLGRFDEALEIAGRAEKLADKLNVNSRPLVAYVSLHKREYDTAISLYLANPPGQRFLLAHAYQAKGMHNEAISHMQRVLANENASVNWGGHPMLAYTYAVAGKRVEAMKLLDEQTELSKHRYISPFNFAVIYLGLGDKDRTFEYLERAYEEHPQTMVHFKTQPMFDSLRSDPRYTILLRKMNLAP